MPDLSPDYAPDLEWMLQSGQVPPELLLEALIAEYYPAVFRLAFAILDNRRAARKTADQVFVRSLLEAHRYQADEGSEAWLFRIALDACHNAHNKLELRRKFLSDIPFLTNLNLLGETLPENELDAEIWLALDRLEADLRQAVIMRLVMDWPPARIQALTGNDSASISGAINRIQADLQKRPPLAQSNPAPTRLSDTDEFAAALKASLEKRWPPLDFNPAEEKKTLARLSRRAGLMQRHRQRLVYALEVGLIVLVILFGMGTAWGLNVFGGEQPTSTPVATFVTRVVYQSITATPKQAEINPASTPTPLSPDMYALTLAGESVQDVAERLNVSSEAIQNLNRLPGGIIFESGQRLLLPDRWDFIITPTSIPLSPLAPAPLLEEPFSASMILQRMTDPNPRYNTLWIDARVIDYGPLSYIGPPRLFQVQMWWNRHRQLLGLIGFTGQLPQEAVLRTRREIYFAHPKADMPWFSEWRESQNFESPAIDILTRTAESLFDKRFLEFSTITISGREERAGVRPLALDVYDQEGFQTDRIWYDDSRGMILRRVIYQPGEQPNPLFEVQITAAAYDIDLPQQLFDNRLPWRGGFASDSSGAPAPMVREDLPSNISRLPLDAVRAPANYNPARSRLWFQYPPSFALDSRSTIIELFTDKYSLGPAIFGNPWQTICQRSPNGKWLAFANSFEAEAGGLAFLNFFELADPRGTYTTADSSAGVAEFAFSPDSRSLAYFARPDRRGPGALYIIDLATRQENHVLELGDIKSLIWSPDGRSLAMISRSDPGSYLENVTVFGVISRQITYNASIDILSNPAGDWPVLKWGVEFPVEMGNMDDCANPPRP